jgi:peptidoglycan hydrolase-like amidase
MRAVALLVLLICVSAEVLAQSVRIGVLGLFHPRQLELIASRGEVLALVCSGKTYILEPHTTSNIARVRVAANHLILSFGPQAIRTPEISVTSRNGSSASFTISLPGEITRSYRGKLVLKAIDGEVVPIITMELEVAVASVVAAESLPGTALEALKAQAVVTRSYFVAGGGRHDNFDFCDLTHCQYLREPPAPASFESMATAATEGLVLHYGDKSIAAMFTRSCGGHTRTPEEIGIPDNGYPYFSVVCDFCYKTPFRWQKEISKQDAAALLGNGEAGRLALNRRLGWNTIPSGDFSWREQGGKIILEGAGQGHGVGLCQRGARAMAERGAGFSEILRHYFPNTVVRGITASIGQN